MNATDPQASSARRPSAPPFSAIPQDCKAFRAARPWEFWEQWDLRWVPWAAVAIALLVDRL